MLSVFWFWVQESLLKKQVSSVRERIIFPTIRSASLQSSLHIASFKNTNQIMSLFQSNSSKIKSKTPHYGRWAHLSSALLSELISHPPHTLFSSRPMAFFNVTNSVSPQSLAISCFFCFKHSSLDVWLMRPFLSFRCRLSCHLFSKVFPNRSI